MERRTSEYRTSALAKPATKWGVGQTGRAIVHTLEIED